MKPKSKQFRDISVRLMKLINILLMTAPFVYVWYMAYADQLYVTFFKRGHWLVIALFMLLYILIGKVYEAFKMSYNSKGEMVYSQLLALFEVDLIMYVVAWLLIRHSPTILPLLILFAIQTVIAVVWSIISQEWYYHTFPANKTIVIWDMRDVPTGTIDKHGLGRKYKVIAKVSVDECIANIDMLKDADTVFLMGIHSHDRNIITKYCLKHNIEAYLVPRVGDLIVAGAERNHMFHLLLLKVKRYSPTLEYMVIKRLGDIILSLIALIIASPIMIITALLIKAEDHGPVLYKQCRLTKDGKEFNILKFRSMRTDAEKDGVARLSTGDNDDRITKVGRVIRKVRIDELPQLLNIIKGEISIVGPRAERPEIAQEYRESLPEFDLRLQTKAGLTGYAQVYGKYNTTPYDKLLMDLMYIANASLFEDVRIIFATVKILFMPDSTEGVESGQTTALEQIKQETDVE